MEEMINMKNLVDAFMPKAEDFINKKKENNKEFVASGTGLVSMLELCYRKGLTCDNSILEYDGEKWTVRYIVDGDTGEYVKIEKQ